MSLFEALTAGWDAATSALNQGTLSFLTRGGVDGDYPKLVSGIDNIVARVIDDANHRSVPKDTDAFYPTPTAGRIVGSISTNAQLDPDLIDFTQPKGQELTVRDIDKAIDKALDLREVTDSNVRDYWKQVLTFIGENESSGDLSVVNTWDTNSTGQEAADGASQGASRGWLQITPDTFSHYHEPGTSTNIYDPVAQASAAMNYIESRYGGQWEHGKTTRSIDDILTRFYTQRYPEYKGY